MRRLCFVTSNKWKFNQANEYFLRKEIELKHYKLELPESRSEEGRDIAKEKVEFAFSKVKQPLFILDGSFRIRTLNNFPKSYVKFADKYIGAEGILKLMSDKKDRCWEFLNILCYKDNKKEKMFIGRQEGEVIKELNHNKKGKVRDFDRVLIAKGYNKTFSEMSNAEMEEYNNTVWRPVAFGDFIKWFARQE
jgi:XTP/dITP diphosphohydrolase